MKRRAAPRILLLVFLAWLPQATAADPPSTPVTVGYGYTTSTLTVEDQEAFLQGFDLGLHARGPKVRRILRVDTTQDPFGAARAARRLLEERPVVVAGFPSSDEALRAAPAILDRGVAWIIPAAGDPNLGKLGPWLISTGGTMRGAAEDTLALLKHLFPTQPGAIVYRSGSALSEAGRAAVEGWLKADYAPLATHLSWIKLDSSLQLAASDLRLIQAVRYLVITLSPRESVLMLDQLDANGMELPMVAVSSWTTGDTSLLRRLLWNRRQPLYSMSVWTRGVNASESFSRLLTQFRVDPARESYVAHGFDAGTIVGETLARLENMGSQPTPESFFAALHAQPTFPSVSTGTLTISRTGGQSDRPADYVIYRPDSGWARYEALESPSRVRSRQHSQTAVPVQPAARAQVAETDQGASRKPRNHEPQNSPLGINRSLQPP